MAYLQFIIVTLPDQGVAELRLQTRGHGDRLAASRKFAQIQLPPGTDCESDPWGALSAAYAALAEMKRRS